MFDYSKMIKRAIEFFPQWSDIRKRHKTSVGGRFVDSLLEETLKIEDAIQDYIDSYFLYNYIGHENEVMAFIYTTNVGIINDLSTIEAFYNDVQYTIVTDIKSFEKSYYTFLYEEGKLYLKVEDYIDGIDKIQVKMNEVKSEYKLQKVHVWNIFDEFATFVNTRRYENETNEQLVKRILYITENLPNGTEEGLKHAIISELLTDCPDIKESEIKIERPTPANLIKAYEDYETLLDLLAEVNRDIYRTKRWDIDYWQYEFESIDYIPHVWDKAIKYWKDGVGSYNDLNVILSDENDTTDASIYFYKKTVESFQKYIHDKHIENDIQFTLTKYNDILNKSIITYKIEASELRDISEEEIYLNLYEPERKNVVIPIEDVAVDWGHNVEVKDYENVDETLKNYNFDSFKIEITSKKDAKDKAANNYDLKISQANILYCDKTDGSIVSIVDLLEDEVPGFVLNSEYELVSESTKKTFSSPEHFNTCTGFKNDKGYLTLADGYSEGYAVAQLSDVAGLYVNYKYRCDKVDMPNIYVMSTSGYWGSNNEYIVRGNYSIENKTVTLNIVANYLSFKIDNNTQAKMTMIYEDEKFGTETIEQFEQKSVFEVERTDTPRQIKLTIDILSTEDVIFRDFKYNCYSILLDTKYGSLNYVEDKGYKFGNFYNNELRLNVIAETGHSPYIENIFISDESINAIFESKPIPYISNTDRVLKIKTNGTINIVELNENGYRTGNIIENYRPYTTYKSVGDNAYIRLDLSEYTSIEDFESSGGIILEKIDGMYMYYNLRFTESNIEIDSINVNATRLTASRIVTLEDMVRFYIPDFNFTYDKIYCSKASKGLIIGRQNPGGTPYNTLITIESEIFKGLDIVKYEMVMPITLGCIFGTKDVNEVRSKSIQHSFDYISIYPDSSQIYQAINEHVTCVNDNRFIPIANNFSPAIDLSKLLFYRVELFDNQDGCYIGFHNDLNKDTSIFDLPTWSIGTSNSYIAIFNNKDMNNSSSYESTTYDINDTIILSSAVDIKDSYSVSNNIILNTEKFIVNTNNKDITIKYDYYNGTSNKNYLLKHEELIVEEDGFNKLMFSNIDEIFHISDKPFTDEYRKDIVDYDLLKDEGIIVWKSNTLKEYSAKKIFLVYSIRKPVAFVFNLNYLYKAIDFDVDAYEMVSTHEVSDIVNGETIDFIDDSYHKIIVNDYADKEPDLIYVSCTNPTFESKYENESITFSKYTTEPTLLVKTGYYYVSGREYYLFSETDYEQVKNNAIYKLNNADISGGEITTYKPTNNYIANSEMRLKGMSNLYEFDCTKPLTYGISRLNHLTSCDSFNEWSTFGMRLKLTKGFNESGLQFISEIDNGYAFMEITPYLMDQATMYISFYASEDLKVFIGIEKPYADIKLNRALDIELADEIPYDGSDLRGIGIDVSNQYKYYLVVQSSGVIDDIIISTNKNSIYEAHIKNITKLGFNLTETKPEGSRYKMAINGHADYKPYNASLMSDGSFKTTSNIDWYVTQIHAFENMEDFKKCLLTNIGVEKNYIYTSSKSGTIETYPIHLNELSNINKLIFKINDIGFSNMKDFDVIVETCDRYDGVYVPCCTVNKKNKFFINGNVLQTYIKLKINMPFNKYINNIIIFADYMCNNDDPLSIVAKQSGYIESKIYDLQSITNCFVKSLDIIDISNINDVSIYIRSSKDEERLDIWNDWREIKINNDLKISNAINFTDVRFLQFRIVLKTRKAFIDFKGIDIEFR